jgi:flagellar hook-associated protein FlgK
MAADLSYALRTAASGLVANQRALDTVANNVANVSTPGFSRKVARFESRVLSGAGAGVELGPLMRTIDEGLLKSVRLERGGLGALSAQSELFARISDLFGSPEANTSLSHDLAELRNAFSALALAPHDSIEQREVVRRADDLALNLRHASATIQGLRADADAGLVRGVDEINTLVGRIAALNETIVRDTAVGRGTADVEDQRDRALDQLSGLIDIRVFSRGGGDLAVFTASGRALVDGGAAPVRHPGVAVVDAVSSYAAGNFAAITVGTGATARDITADIRGGRLAGLIEMRDKVLPDLQAAIDTLAGEIKTRLNQAHNAGLAYPGLTRLDGSRRFTEPAQQTVAFAGAEDTRLVLFDASGNQVRSTSDLGAQPDRRDRRHRLCRGRRDRRLARRRRQRQPGGRHLADPHRHAGAGPRPSRRGRRRRRKRPDRRRHRLRRRRRRPGRRGRGRFLRLLRPQRPVRGPSADRGAGLGGDGGRLRRHRGHAYLPQRVWRARQRRHRRRRRPRRDRREDRGSDRPAGAAGCGRRRHAP